MDAKKIMRISDRLKHFWHVVSNVRPIVWMVLYLSAIPIFAMVYNCLPDGQFRIPDGAPTDYGSWLYYSMVTITTLGFGDYTPAHGWAQAATAVEVGWGITLLGFFINAVGSMKSEIDVTSALEKQRLMHYSIEQNKINVLLPTILHRLDRYVKYCAQFSVKASDDKNSRELLDEALRLSLFMDSISTKIDFTLWPEIVDNCFALISEVQIQEYSDSFDKFDDFAESTSNISKDIEQLFIQAANKPLS